MVPGAQVYGAPCIQIDAAALVVGGFVSMAPPLRFRVPPTHRRRCPGWSAKPLVILHRRGVGLDGGIVVHGEGAAIADIDAAALGITVGVAGAGQVAAYAGIARHGELAGKRPQTRRRPCAQKSYSPTGAELSEILASPDMVKVLVDHGARRRCVWQCCRKFRRRSFERCPPY